MHIVRTHSFGPLTGIELGFGPLVPPILNVFCYLVGDLMIDTGQSRMAGALRRIINGDGRHINVIALTHHHEDHSGNAALIKSAHNAIVYGHPYTVSKLSTGFAIPPVQCYNWGKTVPVAVAPLPAVIEGKDICLVPVPTPGHSRDHTAYYSKDRGWLFSGDLFVGPRIKFFRVDENFAQTIASLRIASRLDFDSLWCGHNPQPKQGKTALLRKLDFFENFYGEINDLLRKGYSAPQIIRRFARREVRLIRFISRGNMSFANMVRSIAAANARDPK